jgi:2-oxo-4-hydroxy-4-carboxy-5-ureidoimidazoline decarboxylase
MLTRSSAASSSIPLASGRHPAAGSPAAPSRIPSAASHTAASGCPSTVRPPLPDPPSAACASAVEAADADADAATADSADAATADSAAAGPDLGVLDHLNAVTAAAAEDALLDCCRSRRWAGQVAAGRPYPGFDALLAAGDEASRALTAADLAEALTGEAAGPLHPSPAYAAPAHPAYAGHPMPAHRAAYAAVPWAAHVAYQRRFGHAFVICLDACRPDEATTRVLAAFRARLGHDPEHERKVTADELRRIAQGRLARLAQGQISTRGPIAAEAPA